MLEYRFPRLRELSFLFPPLMNWRRKKETLIIKRAKEINPRRVLEVGCGSGYLSRSLSKVLVDAEILGIDLSESMVAFARQKEGGNLRFEGMDFFDVEGPFDLVVSIHAFEEMEPVSAFSKLNSILDDGGVALLVLTCPGLFSRAHSRFFSILNGKKLNLHEPREWMGYAKRVGLSPRLIPIVALEKSILLELRKDGVR